MLSINQKTQPKISSKTTYYALLRNNFILNQFEFQTSFSFIKKIVLMHYP